VSVEAVVELVVAEPVEASKRPQEKANEAGGLTSTSSATTTGSATRSQYLKIDFRAYILLSMNIKFWDFVETTNLQK